MTPAPHGNSKWDDRYGLAANVIAVVRLPVLVDVIAISAGIAVILVTIDARSKHAAKDRTGNCAGPWLDARKNCAGNRTRCSADCSAGNCVACLGIRAVAIVVIAVVPVIWVIAILVRVGST